MPPLLLSIREINSLRKLGSHAAILKEARAFFTSLARIKPLLIVLEDLHWSDQASLDRLRYLARQISDVSVLVIVTSCAAATRFAVEQGLTT